MHDVSHLLEPVEHFDSLLVLFLLAVVGCACGGLWLGLSLSAFPFWGTVAAFVAFLLVRRQWALAVAFVGTLGAVWLLTAYSFAYRGHDVAGYHLPISEALARGWNPMHDRSLDNLAGFFGGAENVKLQHAFYQAKFQGLCAAAVMAATGIFSALPFAGWTMAIVLGCVSYRFARFVWTCSRGTAILFSSLLVFCPCTFGLGHHMRGNGDYLLYTASLAASQCGYLWLQTRSTRELLGFSGAILIAVLTRYNGLLIGMVLGSFVCVFSFRCRRWWWAVATMVVYFLLVGTVPYLRDFPSMPNLTDDFVGNADAGRMGWFARVVYFWFSHEAVVWWFRHVQGLDAFAPHFFCGGGKALDGLGDFFRLLMIVSVILSALTRGWRLKAFCGVLFLGSMCVPLKYLGYARYFPLVWSVPVVFLFDFCCRHRGVFGRGERIFRMGWLAGLLVVYLPYVWSCLICIDLTLANEKQIQNAYEALAARGVKACRIVEGPVSRKLYYVHALRTHAAGILVGEDEPLPAISFARARFFFPWLQDDDGRKACLVPEREVRRKYDFCGSKYTWRTLSYPWGFSGLPHLLWRQ